MRMFRRILVSPGIWRNRVISKRQCSSSVVPVSDAVEKRNFLFVQEQKRQLEEVGRVEQITVEVSGPPEDVVLVMNQNISTPYDCCKHLSLPLCQRSALALVDNKILWDMHRPLPGNCKLKFLSFRDKDPYNVNEAFWRTGSFVLGAVILRAFKKEAGVRLYKFPECKVNTGSFFYDVDIINCSEPLNSDELQVLSGEFLSFVFQNHKIERLNVKKSYALQMFKDNPHKVAEIPTNASESGDNLVTLYKVGDHIDICHGPMIGDTSFFGRATVAACHKIFSDDTNRFRFQGVSLPKGIMLNAHAYGILVSRARILNEIPIPELPYEFQPYSDNDKFLKNSSCPIIPKPAHMQR